MPAISVLLLLAGAAFCGQPPSGLWDATIEVNHLIIPFQMEITPAEASFLNGDEKVTSTDAMWSGNNYSAKFAHYAGKLEASWKDGALQGSYTRVKRVFAFHAVPHRPPPAAVAAPSIAGSWDIATSDNRVEPAWRMVVRQAGPNVSAAILRIDGDTGTLSGTYQDGKFVLGHFSGARPALLVLVPATEGRLAVTLNGNAFTATRTDIARARGLPAPADPAHYISVKDPAERLRFSLPDLQGNPVTESDPRFKGKVVLLAVGGSWCANCHDEAPFLVDLYHRYRGLGLEVVSLSFEEEGQSDDPQRLRAFIRKYGIDYTVLLGGDPGGVHDKLPQAVNLEMWPATFFLGRDGRVRATRAGFASAATGELHQRLKREVTTLVEQLLAEAPPPAN